jgi:hypothetical protein
VNPVELLNDQSAPSWKLPASRISTPSEEMTESPETIGETSANMVATTSTEIALQSPIAANEGFLCFKALVPLHRDTCKTVEIRADTRLTYYWL